MIKYEYRNSGIGWMGTIPNHWKLEKIKYVTNQIIDGTHFTPDYIDDEEGIAFLRVTDIQTEFINLNRIKRISFEEHCELNKRCNPEKGDLLLSKNGTIGLTKIVDWDFPCSLFVSLCLIKPMKKVSARYLDHLFKGGFFDQQISDGSKATTVTNLHLDKIREFKFITPPIPEQIAISTYLDKAFADIDRIVEIKRRQIDNLQEQLKSIIYHAVTKGLNKEAKLIDSNEEWIGKIPKAWKMDRLKDLVELRNEKTDEKSDIEDYLELEDLEKETGRILGFRTTEEVSSKVTIFKKGDVLFGKLRPYLNKHYLAKEDGKCTGEILAFKCNKISNRYFEYCISSHGFIETCTIVSYGAKMPRVDYTTQLAYFYLPIPSPKEQEIICDTLDKVKEKSFIVQSGIEKQLKKILAYKKSLIHEVVTGKKQVYGLSSTGSDQKKKQPMQID
jgi:type I restriction enzyme, S subunit